MPREREVHAPSGLRGVVRNLKGTEANILADEAKARKFKTFEEILANCWLRTDDPGPCGKKYLNGSGAPDWSKVLMADRFYTLVQIRIATYKTAYSFGCKCSHCNEPFEWDIDIDEHLPLKRFSEESIRTYLDGNRFPSQMPDGRRFWYQLLIGKDEMSNAKKVRKSRDELVTLALVSRIIEVEGVSDLRAYVEDMDFDAQQEIIELLDDGDAGYDNEIEIECPECFMEQDVRVPFGARFWMRPKKKRRKSKEQVSAASSQASTKSPSDPPSST